MVGVASVAATPGLMMCAAIKLTKDISPEFERTLALPDTFLRSRYAALNAEMDELKMAQPLRDAFEKFCRMSGNIIHPSSSTAPLAEAADDASLLILPSVREFVLGRKP
jgi:hypothetical protein